MFVLHVATPTEHALPGACVKSPPLHAPSFCCSTCHVHTMHSQHHDAVPHLSRAMHSIPTPASLLNTVKSSVSAAQALSEKASMPTKSATMLLLLAQECGKQTGTNTIYLALSRFLTSPKVTKHQRTSVLLPPFDPKKETPQGASAGPSGAKASSILMRMPAPKRPTYHHQVTHCC
jgi:hypothetical protein